MTKSRLEAFSDGVLAVIITIMVLEIKVPAGGDLASVRPVLPLFLGYVLSFIYVGIYWSNHHHLLHLAGPIGGGVMWANLHLLFWISLVPVATAWVGQHASAPWPTALYGIIRFMAGLSWLILQRTLIHRAGKDSLLARAIGKDLKGRASAVLYLTAIAAAFWMPAVSQGLYVLVALMWLVPDRRVERMVADARTGSGPDHSATK